MLKSVNQLGNATYYSYDQLGNLLSQTNSLGQSELYAYDLLGRQTVSQTPYDQASYSTVKNYYDANGNLIKSIDADGYQTNYYYNSRNLLTAVEAILGSGKVNITKYEYDAEGRNTKVFTGLNSWQDNDYRTQDYSYDALGRLVSSTDGLGQKSYFSYDANGNMLKATNRNGVTVNYSYDGLNRLVQKQNPQDSTVINYYYDQLGQLIKTTDATGDTLYSYDDLGRLLLTDYTNGIRQSYTYNNADKLTGLLVTNGGLSEMSLGYSYDAAGNLINVNESGKNFSYSYDAAGRLIKESNGVTGITSEYAYYVSGNIKDLRNFGGGNLLDNYEYSYDSRGNRTEEIKNGRSTQYYYDALSRISSCLTEEGGSLNYSYDDLGNICQVVVTGQNIYGSTPIIETNYSYDQNNRLLLQETVNGNSLEQVRFRYDNEGNQTEKAEVSKQNGNLIASNTLTFSYNGFNQLANVTDSDNNLTVYTYNAQGLRTSKHKANDGTTTKYYYDGSANIILETTAENAVTAKNVRGFHLISRENAGAEPFYYLFNAHGDVTKLTDELGNVIKDYNYDPFGNEKSSELNPLGGNLSISLWQTEAAAIDNPFRYCGEYLDFETNNYYLRARYYDPAIERFLSEDTYTGQVTDPLSLNFYIYCKNNPIIFVDASGYDPVPIWVKNINAGKGTEADYNEAFKVYEKGSASAWAGTARFAVDKAIDKTLDIMYADRLPKTGEPNSVRKIYNPDGTVKQERIYGPDGQPVRDRDYNHGGEGHEFPHDHDWVNGERQPGVPVPKPDPTQGTNISSSEAEEAAGWAFSRNSIILGDFRGIAYSTS